MMRLEGDALDTRPTAYETSFAQKQMYDYCSHLPRQLDQSLTKLIRITGRLNQNKLENALQQLVQRHEILRTRFVESDGDLLQQVHTAVPVQLALHKVEAPNEIISDFIRSITMPSLDLNSFPLFRFTLVSSHEKENILVLAVHPLLADIRSMVILAEDLISLYANEHMEQLAAQYVDFTLWQNDALTSPPLERQARNLEKIFDDYIPYLDWVLEPSPPDSQTKTSIVSEVDFKVSGNAYTQLKRSLAQQNLSLNDTLFAIYFLLLRKYTNNNDIVVGISVAMRMNQELERVAGLVDHTHCIRMQIEGDGSFRSFVNSLKEHHAKSKKNNSYPLALIENSIKAKKQLKSWLLQVYFVEENETAHKKIEGLLIKDYPCIESFCRYDMKLSFRVLEDAVAFSWLFDEMKLSRQTMELMAENFVNMLFQAANAPEMPIKQIQLKREVVQPTSLRHYESENWASEVKVILDQDRQKVPIGWPGEIFEIKEDKFVSTEEIGMYDEKGLITNLGYAKRKTLGPFKPFNEIYYVSCFYSALFAVMSHFGLRNEIVTANHIHYYNWNQSDEFFIDYVICEPEDQLLARYGLASRWSRKAENLVDSIIDAIKDNKVIIIWVDCYYIPFRYDLYQKEHWGHSICVYGYNETQKVFHILEQNDRESLSYRERFISFEDLLHAYEGYIHHLLEKRPNVPSYFELFTIEEAKEPIEEDLTQRYTSNLMNYRGQFEQQGAVLNKLIEQWIARTSTETAFHQYGDLIFGQLNDIINAKQAEKYRWGTLAREANMEERVTELIQLWSSFRTDFGKLVFSPSYKINQIQVCMAKLSVISTQEEQYQQALFRELQMA